MSKRSKDLARNIQKQANEALWHELRYLLSVNYHVKSEGEAEIWLKTERDDVTIEVYPANDGETLAHVTVWSENGGYGEFNRSTGLNTLPQVIEHIDRTMQAVTLLVI